MLSVLRRGRWGFGLGGAIGAVAGEACGRKRTLSIVAFSPEWYS